MKKNNTRKKHIFFYVATGFVFFLAVVYNAFIKWATLNFGITIKEILFTIISPMNGADTNFLKDAIKSCLPVAIISIISWVLYVFIDTKINKTVSGDCCIKFKHKQVTFNWFNVFKALIVLALTASLIATTVKADNAFKLTEYISSYIKQTTIYEEHYVNPNSVKIESPSKAKNLIYIYLESMETTYASISDGGYQQENNYIPNLTNIAKENISFSNSEKLGGFSALTGTTWTIGSLIATTAGVPFSFPLEGNSMGERSNFAKGITTLGDVLKEKGYVQEFLCGSDGNFAGRKNYFVQHGDYNVFDIYSAKEKNYIPEDYYVWWGYEDEYLYEIAKKELTQLYENNSQPFNFTMLTVDTHHVDGYICGLCSDMYENQLENVLTCADLQITNFIEWCKEQPFYQDTVIVITGDHPRMDTTLVSEVPYLDRTIYNCFINTNKSVNDLNLTNRDFTSMDIFPTILSALDFKIEGNRLGLGTDMFSGEQTLAEKIGIENLNDEINKYSKYYIDNFS